MKPGLLAGVVLAASAAAGLAQDVPAPAAGGMQPPRIVAATIDWSQALAEIETLPGLKTASLDPALPLREPAKAGEVPPALARLNAAMGGRFAEIARSPVPVLLPFDTDAYLREREAGTSGSSGSTDDARYLSGFHARTFFHAGPSGYDAAFAVKVGEVPDLADIKFSEPVTIVILGSSILYELDDPTPPREGTPVAELEGEFPGIRRLIHEHHVRYTFERYGVPYAVSTPCFDSSVSRYRMPTCRTADRIIQRFLRALRVAGGTPQERKATEKVEIERPEAAADSFSFHAPGKLLGGTGFRSTGGLSDRTVYARMRFPLEEAPGYVNSQMFQSRNRALVAGQDANYSYPWRDNFCERRGFPVGQCPGSHGHQGQDIRPARCTADPASGERCVHRLVAVRDGAVMRGAGQEALYIVVNTETEHLRFRYLHMHPRRMDEDGLFSGRLVREGETVGEVSNYSKKEGGTSYHLHFDIQVPTRHGWVFVNPYMTLVASYERLIGGRGAEIDPAQPQTDPQATGTVGSAETKDAEKPSKRSAKRAKSNKKSVKRATAKSGPKAVKRKKVRRKGR